MSLVKAMQALKQFGDMVSQEEVIIEEPLTTTVQGPANDVSEIPQPHSVPMSMELYDRAFLLETDLIFMSDSQRPSKLANTSHDKQLSVVNSEWKETEINMNHMDDDETIIQHLKEAYGESCGRFNHEICSVNLRKGILYESRSLVKTIIKAHSIPYVENPRGIPIPRDKSSIVNMMDVFRQTPLMMAARVGNYKLLLILLEHGADPSMQTPDGQAALFIAAKHHDEKLIEILIDYGANVGLALMMSGLSRPYLYEHKRPKEYAENRSHKGSHYGFNFEPIFILSQPKFLLRTKNPVLEAFKVGTIINKIGDKKDEYMLDCDTLAQQTDDFAYYYLDQCRSMWEALLLLTDRDENDQEVDLLEYALKKKKMKFISHHYCQQLIMDKWYGGVQHHRVKTTLYKLGQLVILHIFMPFFILYSLIKVVSEFDLANYIGIEFTQPMSVWRKLHVPVISYLVDFFNFFVLLMSLIQTCIFITTDDVEIYESPEVILWMCLAARFMVEMDKIRMQGKRFFKSLGNCVDLSVSCCIIITVLMRIITEFHIADDVSKRFGLWTSYIYATAFLGLMLRMLEMLDITYTLGPLEGAISKMLMDVVKVCVLLAICMVGFTVSMWTVTKQSFYVATHAANSTVTSSSLPTYFSSFNVTLVTLLWSTFGLISTDNVAISYDTNASGFLQVLWGVYILTAMVLFLNMLIAMLTETYVNTINNAETEWKFARSVVVTKYEGTHPFIFPVNLLLYPLFLVYHCVQSQQQKEKKVKEPTEEELESWKQSAYLHISIKNRFKSKFNDVLRVPYHYKSNVFDFFKSSPFQKKNKRRKRKNSDSESSDNISF